MDNNRSIKGSFHQANQAGNDAGVALAMVNGVKNLVVTDANGKAVAHMSLENFMKQATPGGVPLKLDQPAPKAIDLTQPKTTVDLKQPIVTVDLSKPKMP